MIAFLALLDALAAPATVLEHTFNVTVDYRRQLKTSQSWTVRIDDPAAVVAGLPAPPGLDGASDAGGLVLEDLFVVPETVQKGDVFTLTASSSAPRGSHSGVFASAPGLPLVKAVVTIQGPSRQPLTVWADPGADAVWSTVRNKSATLTWTDLSERDTANAVYSTWKDWASAGAVLEALVDKRLATKSELGRELGQNLKSTNLPELIRRVFQAIKVEPGVVTGWEGARSAVEMASARRGSPAERGVVLISVLRLAGYKVAPALYRPASNGPFPITVPGPALLSKPLVIARNSAGRVLYIDPANDAVASPTLPAALAGSTVWMAGDLPRRFDEGGTAAGTVTLSTAAKIDRRGDVTWTTDVAAAGAGIEAIRTLLRTLNEDGRKQALERLVRQGRPDLDRLAVTSSGTIDPYRDLKLSVSGADLGVFKPYGPGLIGTLQPALGPAMAGWLPPNIQVTERMDIIAPDSLLLLATSNVERALSHDALVDRKVARVGPRVQLEVSAIRPYAIARAERDQAGSSFLAEQASQGVELIWFPPASGKASKLLKKAATDADAVALDALLWWSADNDKKARSILKKALKTGSENPMIAGFSSWAVPGDDRPWAALHDQVPLEDPAARLVVLEAAADHGSLNYAVDHAKALLSDDLDDDAAHNARVWLLIARRDRDATVLAGLGAVRGELAPRAAEVLAGWKLEQLEPMELDQVPDDTPERRGLHLVAASAELPRETLVEQVRVLRDAAPINPIVARRASEALIEAGLYTQAAEAALDAARLAHDDPSLWAHCAEAALLAGRLPLALAAGQRASDLDPTSSTYARRLHHLAVLATDTDAEALARSRSGGEQPKEWPPTVDDLLSIAEPTSLLAVLQYHDAQVLKSPITLALRAQLRTDAGLLDAAARDSIILYERHHEAQGPALAFAATVGRVLGHGTLALLSSATDDVAKLTRMEYRLITNSSDPRVDARALREQPRAEDVLAAAANPKGIVARTEGWPTLTSARIRAPRGYRMNPILSGPAGVIGFSHSDRQVAVLHVNGETDLLPPPLSVLYTLQDPPIADHEGVTLFRLVDGYLPLYGARTHTDGTTRWGLAFTAEAARRAVQDLL